MLEGLEVALIAGVRLRSVDVRSGCVAQRGDQLLGLRPHPAVDVDAHEADDPLLVDHQGGRMRELAGLLVQQSVGPDRLALGIDEEGESEPLLLPQGLELAGIVGGQCPELGAQGGDLVAMFLQLTELLAAVRSPAAAKENQDEGLLVAHLAQRVGFPVACDEGEGGRFLPDLHAGGLRGIVRRGHGEADDSQEGHQHGG